MTEKRSMIHYKSKAEIELMRESALLVSDALALVASVIKPGVTTMYLDKIAEEFIRDNKATASFKGYQGFPYTCCISVNDAVVHGFPDNNELKDGDIVSVDVGVFKNGFHGDSAYTFGVGEIGDELKQLMRVTKESLYKGHNQVALQFENAPNGVYFVKVSNGKLASTQRVIVQH